MANILVSFMVGLLRRIVSLRYDARTRGWPFQARFYAAPDLK